MEERNPTSFEKLLSLMDTLRSEKGCPWDRAQTRQSLKPYLVEEAYEVLEAIDRGKPDQIKEELGDLLFQVIFHARISQELGEFDIEDILKTVFQKMVRRHPHIFGQEKATTPREVLIQWEAIKRKETGEPSGRSALEGVPSLLPALLRAYRIQEKASRVGFDWEESGPVLEKVREEWREFDRTLKEGNKELQDWELGDLLFSLVNLARFLELHPEEALRRANERFIQRFDHIERRLAEQGKAPQEASLDEMDALWEEAKKEETKSQWQRTVKESGS